MTIEQRSRTQAALRRYGMRRCRTQPDKKAWTDAIDQTLSYYDERDPVRSGIIRLRYFEHRSEEEVLDRLHIGRTTYQKAQLDLLSTVAVYAAKSGAIL